MVIIVLNCGCDREYGCRLAVVATVITGIAAIVVQTVVVAA